MNPQITDKLNFQKLIGGSNEFHKKTIRKLKCGSNESKNHQPIEFPKIGCGVATNFAKMR